MVSSVLCLTFAAPAALPLGSSWSLTSLADLQMGEALGIPLLVSMSCMAEVGKGCFGEYGRQRIATFGDGDGLPLDQTAWWHSATDARFVRVLLGGVVAGGAFYLSESMPSSLELVTDCGRRSSFS